MQDGSNFAIEGREAAFMIADPLLIDPYMGAVVRRADVEKHTGAGLGLRVEVALIKNDALVAEELWNLGVPIAGHLEGRSRGEVILGVVRAAGDIWMGVHGVAAVVDFAAAGIKLPERRLIHQIMPVAIEVDGVAMVHADDEGLEPQNRGFCRPALLPVGIRITLRRTGICRNLLPGSYRARLRSGCRRCRRLRGGRRRRDCEAEECSGKAARDQA